MNALDLTAADLIDFRIVGCEACGTEGRIYHGEYDDGWSEACIYCEGTGGELIAVEPITIDDLVEMYR